MPAETCMTVDSEGNKLYEPLTAREIQLLQLAADGLRSRDIAAVTGMTFASVKNLWKSAYDKLGADNLPRAVAMALRRKLIV
jgi:DNA-binding CsgD family transcriptional regulator